MKFWFPISEIPDVDLALMTLIPGDLCIEIEINEYCQTPQCKSKHTVIHGSNLNRSWLGFATGHFCYHSSSWSELWKNRIIVSKIQAASNVSLINDIKTIKREPMKDGCMCVGSCGSWVPMAIPNRDDGTFICYSCKINF